MVLQPQAPVASGWADSGGLARPLSIEKRLRARTARHPDSGGYQSPLTAAIFRILGLNQKMLREQSRWDPGQAANCRPPTGLAVQTSLPSVGSSRQGDFPRDPVQNHPEQHFAIPGV